MWFNKVVFSNQENLRKDALAPMPSEKKNIMFIWKYMSETGKDSKAKARVQATVLVPIALQNLRFLDSKAKARVFKQPCWCPSPASERDAPNNTRSKTKPPLLLTWGLRLTHVNMDVLCSGAGCFASSQ
mmetsp:Transcript_60509/g.160875  ORF Transcript_60509/g.160875 Transcript_60509/m.160875 type:complete len:129 (-) Transcript_60509:214-600(-)